MVTTTAPSPFLARLSAGTEDSRPFPTSLFQRLLRADYSSESPQPSCCPGLGSNGSARPSLKRVRRRRRKIRSAPCGLLQCRCYQQLQQHRAGLGRRNAAQGTRNRCEVSTASSDSGLETGRSGEEAPAPSPRTTPVVTNKPFRKEVRRTTGPKSSSFSKLGGRSRTESAPGSAGGPNFRYMKAAAAGRFHGRG